MNSHRESSLLTFAASLVLALCVPISQESVDLISGDTCAKLCRKNGGDLEQIKFLLGPSSIQTTSRYLGSDQEFEIAVNDNLEL
jgi:hypothetical protein